ncbi:hypothetical protein [Ornithinimicrobium tianjinense]|uniref:Uncharacterized protein n=1 Tax=Ornithinimicrobium tianjinense TaxID=1195761 RepID=A0A917BV35_9MICO|nr:hypothetical protein [Ornithinimicrobium tianjinense]GGF57917.1 hypothetical protein GCM10011366_27120 [Ornithinimicrobium tianjinense]
MARLDEVRQRIEVTERELEALREINHGAAVSDSEAGRRVRESGLVVEHDGTEAVHPLVLDLVQAVHEPLLQVLVEVAGPQGPTVATVAVHGETMWYTDPWPGETRDATVYHRDELTQLVFLMARLTGLRRHEVPAAARPFSVPLGAVDAVLGAMAVDAEAWDSVRTVVTAKFDTYFDGLPDEDAHLVMATLAHLRSSHRVTVVWGPEVSDCAGVAVWDCGDGGYWVRESPAEPLRREDVTPETVATFRPVRAAEVWTLYAGLLPGSSQLREAVTRAAG